MFAVGDIHGRLDLLVRLVDQIEACARSDRPELIFLGDYVDRGPDSAGVIDHLVEATGLDRFQTRFLKGNHEAALLRFLNEASFGPEWVRYGGDETLASYGVAPPRLKSDADGWVAARNAFAERLPDAHLDFLKSLSLAHECGPYFFAHAGVNPDKPLSEQDEEALLWIREAFLEDRRPLSRIVVHGHTPALAPHADDRRIGVDTGAYQTGVLTAVRLHEDAVDFIQTR